MPHTLPAAETARSCSRPTSPSFFQRLGGIDLFNDLIFNREKVYQSLRRFSPVRTRARKEEEGPAPSHKLEDEDSHPLIRSIEPKAEERDSSEDTSMPYYLRSTHMAVSNPRGRLLKETPAKAKPKGKPGLITPRKRSSPATHKAECASKVRKMAPKANSGRRVNGRGASLTDAVVISDDSSCSSSFQPRRKGRNDSFTPLHQLTKGDSPSSEDDLNLPPTYSNSLKNELMRMNVVHTKELEQLRQQLFASEAKVKLVKEDAKREADELQRQHSIKSDKQLADLNEVLEAERRISSSLSWECNYLHRELETAGSRLVGEADLIRERDAYERRYKKEQDVSADLKHGLAKKDKETARIATAAAEGRQQLVAQMGDLYREVAQLKGENAALKTVSPSQRSQSDTSKYPAPSQSSTASSAEQRLVNVRKTYVTVKRRYDSLHAVATNLSTTTRTWDYGNFGEFGQYLRQLKAVLDESGQENQFGGFGSSVAKVD